MPNEPRHLDQHRHNAIVSLSLEAAGTLDWAITTMFYAALHLVDAYLARLNVHPNDHRERKNWIGREANLRRISSEYINLELRSKDARYQCLSFTPVTVQVVRARSYLPVETHLRSLLGM